MIFEQTNDYEYIKYCLTHPYVWKTRGDDMKNVDPELFFPPMSGIFYLKAGEFGLLLGIKFNPRELDVHFALMPSARGMAIDISKQAISWCFRNMSDIDSLTALIPSKNLLAIKVAEKSGMKFICNREKSFLKDGAYIDQYFYMIKRGDIKC